MKSQRFLELFHKLAPILLIISFTTLSSISLVSIQRLSGDAKVINMTGYVRGASQRLVKQEMNGIENDILIHKIDEILVELSDGNEENLIMKQSLDFRNYVTRMERFWEVLKNEIDSFRQNGNSEALFQLSEEFFELADKSVSIAEVYAEYKVRRTMFWLVLLNGVFIILIILFYYYDKRQKKMYTFLKAAEDASREKSKFLSKMSHEIRTPMNGIIGMTEMAQMSIGSDQRVKDCLDKIKLSSDYLLSLINDILDMSRIESGKVEIYQKDFDIRVLADRLYIMFEEKVKMANIDFRVEMIHLDTPMIKGDELRLNQIVVNIVSNAIKFTPAGGKVSVVIEEEMIGEENILLKINVTDTGIGMSKKFLDKIFEPFEQEENSITNQSAGTGLGLAISYYLVQLMNGNIFVSSELGKGSSFIVQLPFFIATDMTAPEVPPKNSANIEGVFHNFHILLAEDNEMNAEIAAFLLQEHGAMVDIARNGIETVDMFLQSEPGKYQMILMDIQMPKMNGLDACAAIRKSQHVQAKEIPIIGLSANAFQQDIERALHYGMNAYVSKPIDIENLLATMAECVDVN